MHQAELPLRKSTDTGIKEPELLKCLLLGFRTSNECTQLGLLWQTLLSFTCSWVTVSTRLAKVVSVFSTSTMRCPNHPMSLPLDWTSYPVSNTNCCCSTEEKYSSHSNKLWSPPAALHQMTICLTPCWEHSMDTAPSLVLLWTEPPVSRMHLIKVLLTKYLHRKGQCFHTTWKQNYHNWEITKNVINFPICFPGVTQ